MFDEVSDDISFKLSYENADVCRSHCVCFACDSDVWCCCRRRLLEESGRDTMHTQRLRQTFRQHFDRTIWRKGKWKSSICGIRSASPRCTCEEEMSAKATHFPVTEQGTGIQPEHFFAPLMPPITPTATYKSLVDLDFLPLRSKSIWWINRLIKELAC